MKMKPILFSTPMVQAMRRGEKTQTRRVIIPQPIFDFCYEQEPGLWFWTKRDQDDDMMGWWPSYDKGLSPKYKPGDILWVRETWAKSEGNGKFPDGYFYKADKSYHMVKWRPSIFMPREAARIFLRVTDVRAERVQDISEADAIAEGVTGLFDDATEQEYAKWRANVIAAQGIAFDPGEQKDQGYTNYLWHGHFGRYGIGNKQSNSWPYQFSGYDSARDSYSSLWELINAKRGYGWDANPWVWAYTFERITKEEAQGDD